MHQDSLTLVIDAIYRREGRRILATLIRLLHGNFDLAEEALHDAFAAALAQWPTSGVPDKPRAWLVSAGRFKAIDRLRRRARLDASVLNMAELAEIDDGAFLDDDNESVEDDRLRLIFTCCHPSLAEEARIGLTLREVCGLTTEAIAAAFLVPTATLAQRIVRAKNKIRDAGIPYEVPQAMDLPERLGSVLHVIYLVFNEGYSSCAGDQVTKPDLCAEAIRLARLLNSLLPEAEVAGLLALMLLHDARGRARMSAAGDLIPLEEQDRHLWHADQIAEGCELVLQALQLPGVGPYRLQAAIAAVHAEASSAEETDWVQIVGLYDALLRVSLSPVIELNRAVAVAMAFGAAEGINLIDELLSRGVLQQYHLAHAARADLFRRQHDIESARQAYELALELVQQEPERRFLQRRLAELSKPAPLPTKNN